MVDVSSEAWPKEAAALEDSSFLLFIRKKVLNDTLCKILSKEW